MELGTQESSMLLEATNLLRQGLKKEEANLTENQQLVLETIMQGHNVLYVDRTGAGKSATYFILTRILRNANGRMGPTMVISPLVSLMNDQVQKASAFGLNAKIYSSSQTALAKGAVIEDMQANTLDMLFITPEMLSGSFCRTFPQFNNDYDANDGGEDSWTQVALVVIDEVHCVSTWGHDFRPSYFKGFQVLNTFQWFRNCQKLGTSATVTTRVWNDIQLSLGGQWSSVRGSLYRENMAIRVVSAATENSKKEWLRDFCAKCSPLHWNLLIFAMTKKEVEAIATFLTSSGFNATSYHADIEDRPTVENDFIQGRIRILVSTVALGMGFDKDDIHAVIHWYTPASVIPYYQEIGRAGRKLPSCRVYVVADKGAPFRTDGQVVFAITNIVDLLFREKKPMPLSEIHSFMSTRKLNVKKTIVEQAIMTAVKRGNIRMHGSDASFVTALTAHDLQEFAEYNQEMERDAKFMASLFHPSEECIWARILQALGDAFNGRCGRCSVCNPKDDFKDPIPRTVRDRNICYTCKTPGGIPVFGLGVRQDNVVVSVPRVRRLLQQHVPLVGANPPACALTFIPGRGNQNEDIWKELAQELALPNFSFLKPEDNAGSVTACNTDVGRQEILRKKFVTFDFSNLPNTALVIIYDDAMKSGATLDFVAKQLLESGRSVVAIVDKIWRTDEEVVTLE